MFFFFLLFIIIHPTLFARVVTMHTPAHFKIIQSVLAGDSGPNISLSPHWDIYGSKRRELSK